MNVNLHIERLVLDGMWPSPSECPLLQAIVTAELTRLLARGGLRVALQSGGALYSVRTAGIQLASDQGFARFGEQIAKSIYGGIGK
jgi:hypothetical protein